jgi:predicted nucleic acid-binding protein
LVIDSNVLISALPVQNSSLTVLIAICGVKAGSIRWYQPSSAGRGPGRGRRVSTFRDKRDLLGLKQHEHTRILTVRDFLTQFGRLP